MSSKYPNQIDSSIELPAVRDNITELNSDVFNSIRSAIFQIEKTLGINPQGTSGNTVASRLNQSLDANGNISQTAIAALNLLTGAISNADVSDLAAIKEHKLNLDFPTTLLQSEIKLVESEVELLVKQLNELAATLAVHLNPSAMNRHSAKSISVDSSLNIASQDATLELIANNVQLALETIYNSHINFIPTNISSVNNSHSASQIYYDNNLVSGIVPSNNVQDAITDIASIQEVGMKNALLNLHSNGRIRYGTVYDGFESNKNSNVLETTATYTIVAGLSKVSFNLVSPEISDVKEFDILTLSNADVDTDNGDYQVSNVARDLSGNVVRVDVFGGPRNNTVGIVNLSITQSRYSSYNINGLNSTVRPRAMFSNTPDVVFANPDAATIISFNIAPSKITAITRNFDIEIDGEMHTIDVYNPSITTQTLDSIIFKINEQAVADRLNILAYKIKTVVCSELAIVHNLPNSNNDVKNRTLEIHNSSTGDAVAALGLPLGIVEGKTDNAFFLNGSILSGFGNIIEFSSATVELMQSTLNMRIFSGTFERLGVRVGDTVVISEASDQDDNGSYRIKTVLGDTITLDLIFKTFSGTLTENSIVHIVRNSVPIEEMNFEEVSSSNGSLLFDTFMNESKEFYYHKRAEINGEFVLGGFVAGVIDISKNFITLGQTAVVSVFTDGTARLQSPNGSFGPFVFVASSGVYKLMTSDGLSFVTLRVNSNSMPIVNSSVTIHGRNEIPRESYRISRGLFSSSLGVVFGESIDSGIPNLIDKRQSGTVSEYIVGESLLEKYIEGPRNELRENGVVSGLRFTGRSIINSGELDNLGNPIYYYRLSITPGIAYINGKRIEYYGDSNIRYNGNLPVYVAMDPNGCILVEEEITVNGEPTTPFYNQSVVHIAYVELIKFTDLRLMIDHLDLKNFDITVGKHGMFQTIDLAVDYARLYKSIYPGISIPKIKLAPEEFVIQYPINIDFDCILEGAGPTTVLKRGNDMSIGEPLFSDRISFKMCLFTIGPHHTSSPASKIENGVTFRDFTYKSEIISSSISDEFASAFINLTEEILLKKDAFFKFEGINFIGPNVTTDLMGEYFLAIGRQDIDTDNTPLPDLTMGNVIISNCKMSKAGLNKGAVYFTNSTNSVYKNIIITSNIATEMSVFLSDTTFNIFEYKPTVSTLTDIIEVANVVTY